MIIHNISIPVECSNNCYDGLIYSVLKYYGYYYEYYNITYFYTNYFILNNGELIFKKDNRSRIEILSNLFSVSIAFLKKDPKKKFIDIVKSKILISPIGILIDPFYCEWTAFYNKNHSVHIMLIIGYDQDKYICLDTIQKEQKYLVVSQELVEKNYIKYFLFHRKNKFEIDNHMIYNILKKIIEKYDRNKDKIKELLFSKIITIKKSDIEYNFDSSPILIGLAEIAEDRKHFSIFTNLIIHQNEIASEITSILVKSSNKFLILKALLTKFFMTGFINQIFLKNVINDIYDMDNQIIKYIEKIMELIKYND